MAYHQPCLKVFNTPFATIGSRDIVTPKTICNHNIISRNEKNRSKLVILQSFSVLCYIFRKWEHFQITKFNSLYGWRASLTLQQLFPIQILLIFFRFEPPPNFIFHRYRPQTWQAFSPLFSPFLVFIKFQVLNLRMERSRDPLLQKAYCETNREL